MYGPPPPRGGKRDFNMLIKRKIFDQAEMQETLKLYSVGRNVSLGWGSRWKRVLHAPVTRMVLG